MIYVFGGISSGKSEFAENMMPEGERVYLATMQASDEESLERIRKHRKMRAGKGFRTIELSRDIDSADILKTEAVLLECLSNLLANTMFADKGCRLVKPSGKIIEEINSLKEKCRELVIVGNDVFGQTKEKYSEQTLKYIEELKIIHEYLLKNADEVYEVVYGLGHRI